MNIKKITGKEVKDAVEWLWSNRKNGGCYHKVVWTEDETDPHPGREWCIVIGWSEVVGGKCGDPEFYCDEGWWIRGAIRYQNRHNAMQCDMDWDFTIPGPCNEHGDCYDLSFFIEKVETEDGWDITAEYLNEYAEEMYEAWETNKEKIA